MSRHTFIDRINNRYVITARDGRQCYQLAETTAMTEQVK